MIYYKNEIYKYKWYIILLVIYDGEGLRYLIKNDVFRKYDFFEKKFFIYLKMLDIVYYIVFFVFILINWSLN